MITFSLNMMKEKAEHNILYNPLADGYQWLEASDYEKQYMKEHPRETPSYTYCSNMANSEDTQITLCGIMAMEMLLDMFFGVQL